MFIWRSNNCCNEIGCHSSPSTISSHTSSLTPYPVVHELSDLQTDSSDEASTIQEPGEEQDEGEEVVYNLMNVEKKKLAEQVTIPKSTKTGRDLQSEMLAAASSASNKKKRSKAFPLAQSSVSVGSPRPGTFKTMGSATRQHVLWNPSPAQDK